MACCALAMAVFSSAYIVIELDPSGLVVSVRRTNAEYENVAAMQDDMEKVAAVLDELGRDRKKLLVDLRDGPRRNDPQFEEAMRRIRPRVFRGFRGVALLVRTAVGALQVKRHMREDGTGAEVFHDEHEALEYLRGQSVRGEVPSSVIASRRTSRSQTLARVDVTPPDRKSSRPPPSSPGSAESGDRESSPPTRPSRF